VIFDMDLNYRLDARPRKGRSNRQYSAEKWHEAVKSLVDFWTEKNNLERIEARVRYTKLSDRVNQVNQAKTTFPEVVYESYAGRLVKNVCNLNHQMKDYLLILYSCESSGQLSR